MNPNLDDKIMQFEDQWNPMRFKGYLRLIGIPKELADYKAKIYEVMYDNIIEGYRINKSLNKNI